MLSKKTRYALKALVLLAENESHNRGPTLISDLAEKGNMPKKFLETILLDLKNEGILESKKGKGGGYYLSKDPDQIYIGKILNIFEGSMVFLPCLAHQPGEKCSECDDDDMSGMRTLFKEVQEAIERILDTASLGKVHQIQQNIKNNQHEMYFI